MKELNEWREEWNERHIRCVKLKLDADSRNKLMADWCEELILKAKKAYYETEETIMTDESYDWFERNLEILRPDSEILLMVGTVYETNK